MQAQYDAHDGGGEGHDDQANNFDAVVAEQPVQPMQMQHNQPSDPQLDGVQVSFDGVCLSCIEALAFRQNSNSFDGLTSRKCLESVLDDLPMKAVTGCTRQKCTRNIRSSLDPTGLTRERSLRNNLQRCKLQP